MFHLCSASPPLCLFLFCLLLVILLMWKTNHKQYLTICYFTISYVVPWQNKDSDGPFPKCSLSKNNNKSEAFKNAIFQIPWDEWATSRWFSDYSICFSGADGGPGPGRALWMIIEIIKTLPDMAAKRCWNSAGAFLTCPAGRRRSDTSPDCLIQKLTSSLLEGSGEGNGSIIGLLITGSGVLRLEPITLNGCANGKNSKGENLQDASVLDLSA